MFEGFLTLKKARRTYKYDCAFLAPSRSNLKLSRRPREANARELWDG